VRAGKDGVFKCQQAEAEPEPQPATTDLPLPSRFSLPHHHLERVVLQLKRRRVAAARVPEAVGHLPLEERAAVPLVPVPQQRLPLPPIAQSVVERARVRVGGARGGGPQPVWRRGLDWVVVYIVVSG
jgi:hypothetical protein